MQFFAQIPHGYLGLDLDLGADLVAGWPGLSSTSPARIKREITNELPYGGFWTVLDFDLSLLDSTTEFIFDSLLNEVADFEKCQPSWPGPSTCISSLRIKKLKLFNGMLLLQREWYAP